MPSEEMTIKIWEIVVSALTPLAIVVAGYFVNRTIKSRENEFNALRRTQDIRKEIYDDIGPKLNKIYCYIADVGDYGNYEPQAITDFKADVDTKFNVYKRLWSSETMEAYDEFMRAAFKVFGPSAGTRARIRAKPNEKKIFFHNVGKEWDENWDAKFTGEKDRRRAKSTYDHLVEMFIKDITGDVSLTSAEERRSLSA
jgi:hypothetical protein